MTKGLSAVWLLALVAVFALSVWGMKQTTPEPPRIPAAVLGVTPIDINQDAQHVIIDNLPTAMPDTARRQTVPPTDTPGLPFCPVLSGQLCQVPPPQQTAVIAPTITPPTCDTVSITTMNEGAICRWTVSETPVPTPQTGGLWK